MKPELRAALAEKGRCDLPGVHYFLDFHSICF